MKRYFNTSGPNKPEKHYTLKRKNYIEKGISLIKDVKYFTIWAPRQTGKSTYFRLLAYELKKIGFKPVFFSVEGFITFSIKNTLYELNICAAEQLGIEFNIESLEEFSQFFRKNTKDKFVLIIDEIEQFNHVYCYRSL